MILNEIERNKVISLIQSNDEEVDVIVKNADGTKAIETKIVKGIDKAKDILKGLYDNVDDIIAETLKYIDDNKKAIARNNFWNKITTPSLPNLIELLPNGEYNDLTEFDNTMPFITFQWQKIKKGSEKKTVEIDGKTQEIDVDQFDYNWNVIKGFGSIVKPKVKNTTSSDGDATEKTKSPALKIDGYNTMMDILRTNAEYFKEIATDGTLNGGESPKVALRKGIENGKYDIHKYTVNGQPLTMELLGKKK